MVYKNVLFLSIIIFIGCKPVKPQSKTYPDCHIFTIANSTDYEGNDETIANIMDDFNSSSNDKDIDIVRIKSISAYDYEEHVKRMYTQNGKLYIVDDNATRVTTNDDYKKFEAFFQASDTITKNIHCSNNSSSRQHYRYFLKVDNKIIINFSANQNIQNIDPALLGKEAEYIAYFENAK